MTDLTGSLDCIKLQKYKKATDYDQTLTKLIEKTKKVKAGKESYEVKSVGELMKIRSTTKKPSPVDEIKYEKIKDLKKSAPAEKTIGFAYPGPDKKTPIVLYVMRFKEEADFNKFLERIKKKPLENNNYPTPENHPPTSRRSSRNTDSDGLNNQEESRHIPTPVSRTGEQPKYRTEQHSRRQSSTISEQPPPMPSSTSKPKRSSQNTGVISYVSTDNFVSSNRRRNPAITLHSPFETSYISTRSTIRESPSSSRRAHSARPRRQLSGVRVRKIYQVSRCSSYESSCSSSTYSSDSSSSSGSSDYSSEREEYRYRSYSSSGSSSDDSSSDSEPELFNGRISGGRSFVISRCTRGKRSGLRCRPVGEFTVTRDTPSFAYEA